MELTEVEGALKRAVDGVITQNANLLASALDRLSQSPDQTVRVLRYVASAALWEASGKHYATPQQAESAAQSIRDPHGHWADVFDAGVIETLLDVLSGRPAEGRRIPENQAWPAMLAIIVYGLTTTQRLQPDGSWRQQYEGIVRDFHLHYD